MSHMKKQTLLFITGMLLLIPTFVIPMFVFSSLEVSNSAEQILHADVVLDSQYGNPSTIKPNLYHDLISVIPDQRILGIILLLGIGVLSYYFLQDFHPVYRGINLILILLSPIFVGSALYDAQVLFFVFLLGLTLFFIELEFRIAALLFFGLFSSASALHSLIGLILVSFYFLYKGRLKDNLLMIFGFFLEGIVGISFNRAPLFYSYYTTKLSITSLIVEFGAIRGYGLFFLALSIFAFWRLWKKTRLTQILFALFLFIVAVTPFMGDFAVAIGTLLLLPLASWSINYLSEQKWDSSFFYLVGILSIFCGLLFSQLAFIDHAYTNIPDQDAIDALNFAKQQIPPSSVVFSHPSNGFLIESVADAKSYTSTYLTSEKDPRFNQKVSGLLFNERDFDEGVALIKSAQITHIFITPLMKNGQVWSRDGEGLLFILRDSNTFKKIYSKAEYDLYEVQ